MFGVSFLKEQKILKLQKLEQPNIFQYCFRQQISKDLENLYAKPLRKKQSKISIKKLLKKTSGCSQSCSLLYELNRGQIDQQNNHKVYCSKMDDLSYIKPLTIVDDTQTFFRTNSIKSQVLTQPKSVRIFYNNLPLSQQNMTIKQEQTQKNNLKNNPQKHSASQKVNTCELGENKKSTFNEFVSFGPKNMEIFRHINTLQINNVQSDILQETERTQKIENQEISLKRKLTKTCSQLQIQKQINKFATTSAFFPVESKKLKSSEFFASLKKAETMKNDYNSDHQSQVVERFQSLLRKVKQNHLQNQSFSLEYAQI